MAVAWDSVATWAVGIFIVVAVLVIAVVVIVAMLTGNGSNQEREPHERKASRAPARMGRFATVAAAVA